MERGGALSLPPGDLGKGLENPACPGSSATCEEGHRRLNLSEGTCGCVSGEDIFRVGIKGGEETQALESEADLGLLGCFHCDLGQDALVVPGLVFSGTGMMSVSLGSRAI